MTNGTETNLQGTPISDRKAVINELNQLLCDFKVLYQNLRGFHWNVKGSDFFTLHEKFEELYDKVEDFSDDVAERILYLHGVPYHTYQDYTEHSRVGVVKDIHDAKEIVGHLLDNLTTTADTIRKMIEIAAVNNDHVSEDMGIGYETAIDEARWMFRSYLNVKPELQ